MILNDIHISGFGKYTHQDFSFSEGINVIYGDNESGKSTLHAYLKSMLFGMERGRGKAAKTDSYSRYYPWNPQAPYGGSLTFSTEEGAFRIERNLDTKSKSLALFLEESGQPAGTTQEELNTLIGHITEDAYQNTISIEQLKAATDASLCSELRNHLSAISFSGTSTLDVTKALSSLKEKKKELRQQIDPQAASGYEALLQEIAEAENRLKAMDSQPDELENRIASLEKALEEESRIRADLDRQMEETKREAEENSLSRIKNPDLYRERIHDALAAHTLALGESSRHKSHVVTAGKIGAGLTAFLLFLLLGIGTFFYELLPFTREPFPFGKAPFLIGFFAASGLALLTTVILFLRSGKDDSDSEAMAAETKQFLENEFFTHLDSSEISLENEAAMNQKLEAYSRLLTTLSQIRTAGEESLKKTVSLQGKLQEAQNAMAKCQREAWEFEQTCKHLSELEEQKETFLRAIEKNKVLENKTAAAALAEETIQALSARLHETFSPTLNKRVSEIIREITAGTYDHLYIDENLSITLRNGGRTIPAEALSRGTIEQIYLALRISAVEILYPELSLPILLDDTFAYYDDSRLHNTLKWLAENYPGQVLLFTCHKREAAFLSRMGAPYHLIALS